MKGQHSLTVLALLGLGTVCAAQECPSGQHRDATGACKSVKGASQTPIKSDVTANWPTESKIAAKAFSDKFGEPDESSGRMVAWNGKGGWSKIAVYRESTTDPLPTPHQTYVEHQVRYMVPAFRVGDLQNFDKNLVIDTRNGTLASRSDGEKSNILALNLADEIVTGKRTVSDAQHERARIEALNMAGKSTPLSNNLMFTPDSPGQPHQVRAVAPY